MPEKLIFELSKHGRKGYTLPPLDVPAKQIEKLLPNHLLREEPARLPEISENETVRHYTRLSTMNYHIDKGFYPLGSCTMKYNPKVNEVAAAMPAFRDLHPLQPERSVQGMLELLFRLGEYLKEITGFSSISLQPAAGAHGELTGIMLIRAYHVKHGRQRTKILVPDSAHGTNPASVSIAGYKAVSIKSNSHGTVDIENLKRNLDDDVAAVMLTNPNTLGIFESDVVEICRLVHEAGGLMYMDGANLNALIGYVRPGDVGFDCMHINLHKTFSTPHGGGGPGSGPVVVNDKLASFLPVPIVRQSGKLYEMDWNVPDSIGKVHTFYGNIAMMVRAYTYIRMHGSDGLKKNTENAIINANYLLSKLRAAFDLPYNEPIMHEFVISADRQKTRGANAMHIAKRLLDYGFHAPTTYFPLIVHEALMIEPTETETKETLDAFAEALLKIDEEITQQPNVVTSAPFSTPVRRLDDALAARQVNVCYKE